LLNGSLFSKAWQGNHILTQDHLKAQEEAAKEEQQVFHFFPSDSVFSKICFFFVNGFKELNQKHLPKYVFSSTVKTYGENTFLIKNPSTVLQVFYNTFLAAIRRREENHWHRGAPEQGSQAEGRLLTRRILSRTNSIRNMLAKGTARQLGRTHHSQYACSNG